MVKKILSILAWVVTTSGIVVLFYIARKTYLETPIQDINLYIERTTDSGFVKKNSILSDVNQICGKAEIGDVNMIAINRILKSNPWIEQNNAFVDLNGNLNIHIKEYEAQLRVFDKSSQSIYITDEGIVLPSSQNHTPYVLIASGNYYFEDSKSTRLLCDTNQFDQNILKTLHIFKAINKNDFMSSCVGQIYCDNHNEFELVLKGIDARVIVGDTCNIDDKLKRMEIFMKKKSNSAEINNLKIINLKYKNQLVCTKR